MGFLDFLTKKLRRKEHTPREIDFLCEQDGESERELKSALFGLLLSEPSIEKAYLVAVQLDRRETTHFALCLEGTLPNKTLVAEISNEFAAVFYNTQHLDVIYLNPAQRDAVAVAATPFYSRPEGP
jgi:hypothetical protein